MCRQLYLLISLLIHGDEEIKLVNSEKENKRVSTIYSILSNIKSAEDVVQADKSKVSEL